MNKEYFNNNVMMALEVEYESGGRNWEVVKGSELNARLERLNKSEYSYFSDLDFCTHQEDAWCRKVLNLAHLNWFDNREWCGEKNLHSFYEVIDFIIENGLS